MADEPKEHDSEIQEILTDLDNILHDLSGGDAAGAEAIAKAASTITPRAAAAVPPPAAPAPAPKVEAPKPAPAPKAEPPKPTPAPKSEAPKAEAPKAAPEIVLSAPAAAPKAAPAPKIEAPTPKAEPPAPKVEAGPSAGTPELQIELAPREGTLPAKKAAPPKPAPKSPGLVVRQPLELGATEAAAPAPAPAPAERPAATSYPQTRPAGESVDKSEAPPQVEVPKIEPPKAEPPKPAPAPAPVAAKPAPAPAPKAEASKPAPAPAPKIATGPTPWPDTIPANVPKDQIRRVSIVHVAAHQERLDLFVPFLDQSALTVSKKPFYLRKVHAEAITAQTDMGSLVGRAKDTGAVAMLAIVQGVGDEKARELGEACSNAGVSLRLVAPDEVQRRSVVVDIMVDLMLLPGEA